MNLFYLKLILKNPKLSKFAIQSSKVFKKVSKTQIESTLKDSNSFTKEEIINYNKQRKYGFKKSICLAADSNMYFDMYGKVFLCCHNRKHAIGDTKTDTLIDIWNSQQAQNARNSFEGNNMVDGCSMCYLNIKNQEYSSAMSNSFDVFSTSKSTFPSRMDFELSNTCNLECIMCNGDFSNLIRKNRENRAPIALRYDDSFLNQLDTFVPHLQFTNFLGGEPQLIKIYYKIWEKLIQENKAIIRVQTNASILDTRFLEMIEKSNQFQIAVSMDALDPDLIAEIRKNINPEHFLKNLKILISLYTKGKIDLSFSICPMILNKIEVLKIVSFASKKNIKINFNQVVSPYIQSLLNLDYKLISELRNTYITYVDEEFNEVNTSASLYNKKQMMSLINLLDGYFERRLKFDEQYKLLFTEDLSKLKELTLDRITNELELIQIQSTSKKELYQFIIENIKHESEESQKHVLIKLMEVPDEYNNLIFKNEKEGNYLLEFKKHILFILNK